MSELFYNELALGKGDNGNIKITANKDPLKKPYIKHDTTKNAWVANNNGELNELYLTRKDKPFSLMNDGFFDTSDVEWTASDPSITKFLNHSTLTGLGVHAPAVLNVTCTTSAGHYLETTKTVLAQFAEQTMMVSFWALKSISNAVIRCVVLVNTVEVASVLVNDEKWSEYKLNFTLPDISTNNISVRFVFENSTGQSLKFTGVYLGVNDFNYYQNGGISSDTAWELRSEGVQLTTSNNDLVIGTTTDNVLLCRRDGSDMLIAARITKTNSVAGWTSGTGTVQVILPTSCAGYDNLEVYNNTSADSRFATDINGYLTIGGTAEPRVITNGYLIQDFHRIGFYYIRTAEVSGTSSGSGQLLASDLDMGSANAKTIQFTARIPIKQWQNETPKTSSMTAKPEAGRISEVIFSSQPDAPNNFLPTNNISIGALTSSADYKGNNYLELYRVLWEKPETVSTSGNIYTISAAKGATYLADWSANKTISVNYTGNELPTDSETTAYIRYAEPLIQARLSADNIEGLDEEINQVLDIQETTIDLTGLGDFVSGTLRLSKVRKQVTINWGDLSVTAVATANASGVIPEAFRPNTGCRTVFRFDGISGPATVVYQVWVSSSGNFQIERRNITNNTGHAVAENVGGASISYNTL